MKIFLIVLLSLVIVGILGIVAFAIYIVGTAPDFNPDNLLKKIQQFYMIQMVK